MSKKVKTRRALVRIFSTAKTGYFYTFSKLKWAPRMTMVKYDPKVNRHCLFTELKKGGKI